MGISMLVIMISFISELKHVVMDLWISDSKKDGDGWHSFNVFPEYIGYNPNTCPEDTPVSCDAVTIFSECCYGGMSMVITEDNGECLDWSPYSICIPRGYKATFYDLC